jgi:hypothetical protein
VRLADSLAQTDIQLLINAVTHTYCTIELCATTWLSDPTQDSFGVSRVDNLRITVVLSTKRCGSYKAISLVVRAMY